MGTYRDCSDIDIILTGSNLYYDDVDSLAEALDSLNTPYLFDISLYSRLDSEELLAHIHRVGKILYRRQEEEDC